MFTEIFLFEIKYRIRRPATWIYFGIFFALSFLAINVMGGLLTDVVQVVGAGGKVNANAPYNLNGLIQGMGLYGILIISAIVGNPVYRDFEHDTHALFYTKPITKFGYLAGRFFGSIVIALFVLSSVGLGIFVGSLMPYLEQEKFGAFNLMAYVQPYLVFIIPNMIFTGAIFFTAATLTRKILTIYIGSVLFLVLYGVASALTSDLDNETLAAFLDPLGGGALRGVTKYWTTAEKNTLLVPLTGKLLANRVIWISVGMLIWGFAYWRFKFSHMASDKKRSKRSLEYIEKEEKEEAPHIKLSLPKVSQIFSSALYRTQLLTFTKQEFFGIVKNIYFIAIVFAGMVLLFVNGTQVGKIYDTPTFPVTYSVLEFLGGTFSLFMLIIIIFYSGELVWKERSVKINQIVDAMPIPNGLQFLSKLFALILVQVVLLFVVMLSGIIVQAANGYYNFEIGLYLRGLFGINLIDWTLTCVLAMLVQVLVNHKFVGHFIMIVYYLYTIFQGPLGMEHKLYQYSSDTGMFYSDMNGYGHSVFPFIIFKIYWISFAIILAVISNLFWIRGTESKFIIRWQLAKQKFNRPAKLTTFASLIIFVGCGSFIFYNTNILNKYKTSSETKNEQAEFEKKYKKYEKLPQPKITDVKLNVDIFPSERNVFVKGTYQIKNKSGKPIDSVIVTLPAEIKIEKLEFSSASKKTLEDKDNGFYIFQLEKTFMPNDSMTLTMDLAFITKGFSNSGGGTDVVYNGTFINNFSFPHFGYPEAAELSDDDTRKSHGLPPKERVPSVYDSTKWHVNELTTDADWVTYEATVSTSPDQIAISPGYLQKEWIENGRRYFHYKMDAKIMNFYSFLSARYEVKKDKWKDVNIEIYYHKGHEYNVERMIYAIKKSLDYFTVNFSPYQYKQVRILEFPRYATFAQSFPNTIPYSESIGFIADVDESDPENINYPFYVTAHEVAHQWWGHQVCGANVQGGAIMVETMAQYSALMVMEKEYGKETMKKFLKYEMDRYLRGRASERKKEMPMITMEGQQYIHYNKGSVVMYALKDYIGEDSLNFAMRKYIKAAAYRDNPYTTSLEFVEFIKKATPDSLKHVITDMFEKITLYENRVLVANYKKTQDGKYSVKFKIEAKKFVADSLGNEIEIPVNDWIDIGIFTKAKDKNGNPIDKELYFTKKKIDKTNMEFEISVDELPVEAGIDPYNKLIDRHPDDNLKKMGAFALMMGG